MFNEILKLSKELANKNANLFKTLVAHLTDMVPRESSPVRRAAGAEQKGVQANGSRKSATTFHKYTLPGDLGTKEYYECMLCHERRITNSFHSDHQEKHPGQKFQVRWYCPACDTHYAVTHRGYHIKNRHRKDEKERGKKRTTRGRPDYGEESDSEDPNEGDEEAEDDEESVPERKRRHPSEGATSPEGSPEKQAGDDLIKISRSGSLLMPNNPRPVPPYQNMGPMVPGMTQIEQPVQYGGMAPPPPTVIRTTVDFTRQPSLLPRIPSGDLPGSITFEPGTMPVSGPAPVPLPVPLSLSSNTLRRTATDEALNGVSGSGGGGGVASAGISLSDSFANLGDPNVPVATVPTGGSLTGGLTSLLSATGTSSMMFPGCAGTMQRPPNPSVKHEPKE